VIPSFDQNGNLAEGIYDCTMEEVAVRFGLFQTSDRRPQLWARFAEFMRELTICDFVEAVFVDGSFVTAAPEPNDIDLVLVVASNYDFSTDLPPDTYNLLSQHRMRRRFGFDIVVVNNDSESFEQAVAFFQQVKQQPDIKKGILRIKL
jgi:Family of unknown function (DUF6932)